MPNITKGALALSYSHMDNKDIKTSPLEQATIATLKALSGKREVNVQFARTAEDSSLKDDITLPLPDLNITQNDRALLRGMADSGAMALTHHNKKKHRRNAPSALEARKAFEALELARCEALGAQNMKGVAKNLNTLFIEKCKNLRDDCDLPHALYIMAESAFTGQDLPGKTKKTLEAWQPFVDARLGENTLASLASSLSDQTAFARATKDILHKLDFDITEETEPDDTAQDNTEEGNQTDENTSDSDNPSAPQSKDEQAPSDTDSSEKESGKTDIGEEDTGTDKQNETSGEQVPPEAPLHTERNGIDFGPVRPYTIYSTAFDEVVEAADLADPQDLIRLRAMLDKQLEGRKSLIAKLANRLQRKLLSQQQRSWQFDMEEGYLDTGRLARIVANPTVPLVYKQEKDMPFKDTVVSLLIDNSGSMRGRPITIAAMCADILAQTMERCHVKVEILGFTTRAWKGGKARELWLENGRPQNPGRLNDLRHIIYKSADTPSRRGHKNLGLMLKEGLLKENIDGEALIWAYNRLIRRAEERKIMIVISDGAPVDDSTLSANPGHNILEEDLNNVITWIENKSPIELTAIGIGHDVTRYYQRAVTLADASGLANALIEKLSNLFDEG